MFVGTERKTQVDWLASKFSRVPALNEPMLVVLVAPPGWGKTRIVQEFYRELAALQPDPAYWPDSLAQEAPDGTLGLSELTASRKAVRIRHPVAPSANADMQWLWLAPASGRLSDGSPAPAFDGLLDQLMPHLETMLKRVDPRPELGHGQREMLRSAADDLASGSAQLTERPERLVGVLAGLLGADPTGNTLPAVLVLDDAHELDALTAWFARELLASQLPALVIATTWPEKLLPAGSKTLSPFCANLSEASSSDRVAQIWLGELGTDDLIDYIMDQFPATDQRVAARLADRSGCNPYALRLLLNTPRVAATMRDGAIAMDPREIMDLNGRLDTLLAEHWTELPSGVRQVLVAAALLGQSFVDDALEAGLRRIQPSAGLGDALASSWIRPLGGSGRVLEFAERFRHEIAQDDIPNFLSSREQTEIYAGALRALRRLLPAEPDGVGRIVLLALHVLLARIEIEDDLAAAAASVAELADRARSEIRRLEAIEYYRQAIGWAERSQPTPYSQLVSYLIDYSAVTRIHYGRPEGETSAARAMALADQHLDQADELRLRARCCLARARRRVDDPAVYRSGHELLGDAQQLLSQLRAPSAEAVRDVRACEIGYAQAEGDYRLAAARARDLAAFSEQEFGPLHRYTIDTLSDLGYCLHRSSDPTGALAVRRTLLERQGRRFVNVSQLQTAGAKNELAFSLLATRNPENFPEAEQLVEEAITSRSRAFGYDSSSAQGARSLRARLWLAQGLLAEGNGNLNSARERFNRAEAETGRLRSLRQERRPGARTISLQRHGEALACLRNIEAIPTIDDALDIREGYSARITHSGPLATAPNRYGGPTSALTGPQKRRPWPADTS
jgi:tetratricopeptide (TPR) repeat protein